MSDTRRSGDMSKAICVGAQPHKDKCKATRESECTKVLKMLSANILDITWYYVQTLIQTTVFRLMEIGLRII